MDFTDRLALALEATTICFERRDNFLSDSDLLDIADAWTTDAPWADDEDGSRERSDHEALVEALYAACTDSEEN